MKKKLSEEQVRLVEHLRARAGMPIRRFPGGVWTTEDILKPSKYVQYPPRAASFGTQTIKALVKLGVLSSHKGNVNYDWASAYWLTDSSLTRDEGDL